MHSTIMSFRLKTCLMQILVGSTSLNNSEIWDDPAYTIPLGFDFYIGGIMYNTIYFPADGLGGILTTFPALEFGSTSLIVPIAQDLIDLGDTIDVSLSAISYLNEGFPGSQILKVEWRNAGFWEDSSISDFINFQVWFYEGSNVIEYRYGPSQINNPIESYEEYTGPIVAFAPLVNNDTEMFIQSAFFLTGNPINPSVIMLTGTDAPSGSLVGTIPDGTVYRFVPQSLSTYDFSEVEFQIFPNPSSNYLNVETSFSEFKVDVYNSLGQKVDITILEDRINISNLANGTYFLKLTTASGTNIKKFLKH